MPSPLRRLPSSLMASVLACALCALPPSGTVGAAMVSTNDSVVTTVDTSAGLRAPLTPAIARPALAAHLEALGLPSDEAVRRVAALDDATVIDAAERLDRMPAGGGALGIAVFVFAVLILTDAIGLTRIFPFMRNR